MLITDPKKQKWMKLAVDVLASQLISLCQTSSPETSTEERLQSLIACLPSDDNWKVISQLSAKATKVPKGEEGAIIEIERI